MAPPCSPSPRPRGGRDTPAQVKSPMVAVRSIRAASPGSLRWHSELGGSNFSMVDQKSTTYRPRRAFIEPDIEPAEPKQPPGPDRNNGRPIAPPIVDEDHPKPLYRDETRTNGWSSPASRAAPAPRVDPPTDETLRPITVHASGARAASTRNPPRSSPAAGRASIVRVPKLPSTRSTTMTRTSESR